MRVAAVIAMLALLALVGTAQAKSLPSQPPTVVTFESGQVDTNRYARWVRRSGVPTPPITLVLHRASCPLAEGASCTLWGMPYDMWLLPEEWRNRFVFMHELGHIFDAGMDDTFRIRFGNVMRDPRPWYDGDYDSRGQALSEDFADVYATCGIYGMRALPVPPEDATVALEGYGREITMRQYRRACRLIHSSRYEPGD